MQTKSPADYPVTFSVFVNLKPSDADTVERFDGNTENFCYSNFRQLSMFSMQMAEITKV